MYNKQDAERSSSHKILIDVNGSSNNNNSNNRRGGKRPNSRWQKKGRGNSNELDLIEFDAYLGNESFKTFESIPLTDIICMHMNTFSLIIFLI